MILAGSRPGDTILDPFFGAGTVGLVAEKLGRKWVGIDLNPEYCRMASERIEPHTKQRTLMEMVNG
jgi:DNA modification methylase